MAIKMRLQCKRKILTKRLNFNSYGVIRRTRSIRVVPLHSVHLALNSSYLLKIEAFSDNEMGL